MTTPIHSRPRKIEILGYDVVYQYYHYKEEDGYEYTDKLMDELNYQSVIKALDEKRSETKSRAYIGLVIIIILLGWRVIECV